MTEEWVEDLSLPSIQTLGGHQVTRRHSRLPQSGRYMKKRQDTVEDSHGILPSKHCLLGRVPLSGTLGELPTTKRREGTTILVSQILPLERPPVATRELNAPRAASWMREESSKQFFLTKHWPLGGLPLAKLLGNTVVLRISEFYSIVQLQLSHTPSYTRSSHEVMLLMLCRYESMNHDRPFILVTNSQLQT